eukprot:2048526-Rhodomonas_salina.1
MPMSSVNLHWRTYQTRLQHLHCAHLHQVGAWCTTEIRATVSGVRGTTVPHNDDIHCNTLIVLRVVTVVRETLDKSLRIWPLG